jgi:hypothetical protein
MAMMSLILP